ncbi:LPS export ABC transporter permease LptF [Arenibaculum pallidiluteum]|uniref:LPS export ABC transporter permease LptF n=1 Tax=Arenibaculum pallidiluteum TaxID=2812559 RepID=UPI001A95DEB3|nr:LPS export ABC transporter permease LptF [Arenibaculum pallidiluteum]
MNKLSRYLLRHLAVTMVFVTLGLTMVIWLTQSLRLIEIVIEGGAPLSLFLRLMVVTLPTFLSIVLPIATVAAVLFTYNRLLMDNELVVMRSIGLSPVDLARPALLLAAAVGLVCMALTLWIAPLASRELVMLERLARNGYSAALLREGVFNQVDEGVTVYVRRREPNGELWGLVIHDSRIKERPVTLIAERGVASEGPDGGQRVLVFDGQRQSVDRATGRLSVLYFDRYALDIVSLDRSGQPRVPDPREQSLGELLDARDSAGDAAVRNRLVVELHQRLSAPFASLAFALVGSVALLTGEFNRRGQVRRIVAAALLIVLLQSLSLGASNLAASNPALLPLMWVLALGPVALGLWALLRPRLQRPPHAAAAP